MLKFTPKAASNKSETCPDFGKLVPFIDKTTLIIPANPDDAAAIHTALWQELANTSVFQSAGPKGHWKVMQSIALPTTPARPLLQYDYEKGSAKKLRLEFNPRKAGPSGMKQLKAILSSILPGGWVYAIQQANITRIDVAVDLPGMRIDDFLLLPQHLSTVMQWGMNGHVQSIVHGKAKGCQTLVYSVKDKRLAKKQGWSGSSVVRVERRLLSPNVSLGELEKLPNPFAALHLTPPLPSAPAWEKQWQWAMFADSVKVRGLECALMLLPEERRSMTRVVSRATDFSVFDRVDIPTRNGTRD